MDKVIIFTTRLFGKGKNEYLFSSADSILHTVKENYALYQFHQIHSKYTKDIVIIRKNLIDDVNNNIGDINTKVQAYLQEKDLLQDKFELIINKKNVNKKDVISFINDTFTESQKKVLSNIKKDKLEDLVKLHLQPSELSNRINIFQIKDECIFGYRCLDLWDDYVDKKEGFISAFVKDVANNILSLKGLSEFFESFELNLVLHGEDIDFASGVLGQDVENQQLLKFNNELKNYKDKISTYVYSHVSENFFMKILANYSKVPTKDLSEKIENYFKNRKEFEKLERELLLGAETGVTKLTDKLKKKFQTEKIY